MTVLTIIQQGLAQTRAQETITQLVGNSNETAVRALALLKREVNELRRVHSWQVLQTEHAITTAAGTSAYSLPSDFQWALPDTYQDRTDDRKLVGPISAIEWQRLKRDNLTSTLNKFFRIQGGTFNIHPTPTAVENLYFEYVSNAAYLDVDGTTTKSDITADTDTVRIDEYLVELGFTWRWLKSVGLPFAEAYDAYMLERSRTMGRDGGARVLNMNGTGVGWPGRPTARDTVNA